MNGCLSENNLRKKAGVITQLNDVFLILLLVGCLYLMFHFYRPFNIDDPWVSSFIYNQHYYGIEGDFLFLGGQNSEPHLFTKSFKWVYSLALSFSSLHLRTAFICTSLIFSFLGLVSWIFVLGESFPQISRKYFCTLLVFSEPFFSMALSVRAEAFCFFLISFSAFLLLRTYYFSSFVLIGVALEAHPAAFMGLAFHILYIWEKGLWKKRAFLMTVFFAFILSVLFYLLLHPQVFCNLNEGEGHSGLFSLYKFLESPLKSSAYTYFFQAKYYRHVPEFFLFLFIIIISLFLKANQRLIVLCLISFGLMLIFPRSNFYYFVYIYPLLLLFVVDSVFKMKVKRSRFFLLIFVCLNLSQYALIYKVNKFFDREAYEKAIQEELPEADLYFGPIQSWYLFKDLKFFPSNFYRLPKEAIDEAASSIVIFEESSNLEILEKLQKVFEEEFFLKARKKIVASNQELEVFSYQRILRKC